MSNRFLQTLNLTDFLSFGPKTAEIDLCPLNVLIGPNGSGKSNFIEAVELLHAAPRNISSAIRPGGTPDD
jgi:predicted ATPase